MSFRIFIGWDSRFPEPGRVLAYSLRKHSSRPLDIRYLDLRHLRDCFGFNPKDDPRATTEFTYSRFLVPWLCDFSGVALFLDNDMLCLSDPVELFLNNRMHPLMEHEDNGAGSARLIDRAIRVRKHDHVVTDGTVKMYGVTQTSYPRKNWSSMMLMDCSRLRAWSKPVVEEANGKRLHRFEDLSDNEIGTLPPGWNDLEHQYDPNTTKLLHWTEGGPWFAQYHNCPHADLWQKYRQEMLATQE